MRRMVRVAPRQETAASNSADPLPDSSTSVDVAVEVEVDVAAEVSLAVGRGDSVGVTVACAVPVLVGSAVGAGGGMTAYEIGVRLVGSEMCIRDSP